MPRIVTLLTDFGLEDPYVGMMKGVILSQSPDVSWVDLCHTIPPQQILRGALFWLDTAPYFPPATLHIGVIDPGVGTERLLLAAEIDGSFFLAPDNGLLAPLLSRAHAWRVHRIDTDRVHLAKVSRTFHGRDILAPAASLLLKGEPLASLGPPIEIWKKLEIPLPTSSAEGLEGVVLYTDHFGNLITNITASDLASARIPAPQVFLAHVDQPVPWVATYSEVAPGMPCALLGSSDRVEIAVRNGNASAQLGVTAGEKVRILTSG